MKIAILSMQEVYNFGSLLQAYGLKKIVRAILPGAEVRYISVEPNPEDNDISVEAIRFHEEDKTSKFHIDKFFIHRLINKFWNKRQNKKFILFQNINFIQYDDDEKIDVCIIGSDEVFNCCNADKWGFTTQLFGNVKNTDRIITYAASCGFTTIDLLNTEMKKRIKSAFTHVSAFSVRDSGTARFVENLTDQPVEFHLDPVLIADFDSEIQAVKKKLKIPDNLCIVYSYHNRIHDDLEIQEIKAFARAHGFKLVTIGASQKWISNMMILDPFELLFVFSKAKFIITDTFHGTIFASKYNGKFATIVRKSNSNKLSDLVKRLNIEEHMISDFSQLEDAYLEPSSKEKVERIVQNEKIRTVAYMKKNLY